jgi:glycerophosphoryl diester phosphodiesterase
VFFKDKQIECGPSNSLLFGNYKEEPLVKKLIAAAIVLLLNINIANASDVDIYAHRGYRAIASENTLLAYQYALEIGVDVIDADIQLTKDNVLVVTHDLMLNKDITKDSNGNWITASIPIKNLTLKQVQSYDVGGIKPGSATSKMYPNHQDVPKVCMPTLLEVISYLKSVAGNSVRLQIEIKTDPLKPEISSTSLAMATALNKLLIETDMVDQVEVQAFEWQALVDLHQLNPNIKTAFLTSHSVEPMNAKEEASIVYDAQWTAPLIPAEFNYNYAKMVAKLHGTFWEPYEEDLTKQELDEAHRLGIKVVAWGSAESEKTDFNYKVINNLIDWRVDGIITDRPDILRGVEAANGLAVAPSYPDISAP